MYDRTVTLETIKKTLIEDIIGRNNKLGLFVSMLNSLDAPSIVSLDGAWGSGKTYFVKQIEALGILSDEDFKEIFNRVADTLLDDCSGQILRFHSEFVPYYFNAWENDCMDDPLQALLFSLINDIEEADEGKGDNPCLKHLRDGKKAINLIELVKNISHGLIDIDRVSELSSTQALAKEFVTAKERCRVVSDELQKLTKTAIRSFS